MKVHYLILWLLTPVLGDEGTTEKPNIVIIVADDLVRHDYI